MADIRKLQAPPRTPVRKKRVAAYARVSTEADGLLHSLSNQVSNYSALIQSRPDWEYVGVYADTGITGTSTDHRDEFRRLIRDCEKGRVDLILVKSISRFARNTLDLLQTVRHLKRLSVEVYFEEQGISTLTGDGELMLTLMAAVAQEEAENTRENVLWAIRKRFEEGMPHGHKRCFGYDWNGECYVPVPEEAEYVRRIFDMYLDGRSSVQIAKRLDAEGVKGISGLPISQGSVRRILDNENYTGALLLQKNYSPGIHKRAINRGDVTMYRVEDDHEPIISRETFERVRALRRERAGRMPEQKPTCFSGLLQCGYCGHAVCRRHVPGSCPAWICNQVDRKGTDSCQCSRRLPEPELVRAAIEAVGPCYERIIRVKVEKIIVFDGHLEFCFRDGVVTIWKRRFGSGPHERGCFSGKIVCGGCGGPYRRKIDSRKHYAAWMCKAGCGAPRVQEAELKQAMYDVIGEGDDAEMSFYLTADRVIVYDDRFEFHMKNGDVKLWRRK